jgi:hypothetical protein
LRQTVQQASTYTHGERERETYADSLQGLRVVMWRILLIGFPGTQGRQSTYTKHKHSYNIYCQRIPSTQYIYIYIPIYIYAKNLQRTSKKLAQQILPHLKRPIASFGANATATDAELHNQGAAVLAPLGALGSCIES